eukprot:TRINITY_DN3404_c2_g1_i1.p1 TRINITY_DN3404_c2_g1~~TRINITY_DN3404_c2_g1_i1.p1  ORF type:complete len:948 (+),score=423.18 TRINITY_DN3404_c2_g1_i1:53-2845(+)
MGKKSHDSSVEYDEESEDEFSGVDESDSEDDVIPTIESEDDDEEIPQSKSKKSGISRYKNVKKEVEVDYNPSWTSTKSNGALGKPSSNTKQTSFKAFITNYKKNSKEENEEPKKSSFPKKNEVTKPKMKALVESSSDEETKVPKKTSKKPNLVLSDEDEPIVIEFSDEEEEEEEQNGVQKRGSSEISIDLDLSVDNEEVFRPRKRMKKRFTIIEDDDDDKKENDDEELIDLSDREIREMDDGILKKNLNGDTRDINFSETTIKKMRIELVRRNSSAGSKKKQKVIELDDSEEEGDGEEEVIDLEEEKLEEQEEEEEEEEDVELHIDDLIEGCKEYSSKILKKLNGIGTEKNGIQQPKSLTRKLKSYQIVGLNWLALIHEQKLNGILADEMGLGKTIQTISLLAYLRTLGIKGPHIIIVPASTLMNWKRELSEWCPAISVLVYHGSQKERQEMREEWRNNDDDEKVDVFVTTYNVIENSHDLSFLKKVGFYYCILDEAHSIKNAKSLRYKKINKIKSKHRLLLTGTPLQNNLQELWALLNFLMPHMFNQENSAEWINQIDEASKKGEGGEKIEKMKAILSPFILRRLKSEVFQELPDKIEEIMKLDPSEVQKKLYDGVVKTTRAALRNQKKETTQKLFSDTSFLLEEDGEVDGKAKAKPQKTLTINSVMNNTMMQLRKITCHPALVRAVFDDEKIQKLAKELKSGDIEYASQRLDHIVEDLSINSDFELHQFCASRKPLRHFCLKDEHLWNNCSKLERLKTLIPQIVKRGERMLIFSQFTRVLDILEPFMDHLGYTYLRLDGQTPVTERQSLIDTFNTEPIPIFLISTKAGGMGINLTAANVAIFYDISFNYTVDRQAEDRCHRLGQEKQVKVYKLIVNDSIEEGMLQMANAKKKLNDRVLEEGSFESGESETKVMKQLFQKLFKGYENDE